MIDIKRHSVTASDVTYDLRIYSSVERFRVLVNVTKEEVLRIITTYKLSPTPLSIRVYNHIVKKADEEGEDNNGF